MSNGNEVPAGFRLESDTTKVSGHEYGVEFLQAESLEAILDYYEEQGLNPEETVRDIWNAANKQGATQGPKGSVRDALKSETYTRGSGDEAESFTGDQAVSEAVSDAQNSTRTHIIGAPRGSQSGPTKKQQAEFGQAVSKAMAEKGDTLSKEELQDLREEYGL